MNSVGVAPKSLDAYRESAGDAAVEELIELARPLQGARVLHVNATAFGGGVAEILHTLVALMRDLGIEAEWQVIEGTDEFFGVTKVMHNGLQGMETPWTEPMIDKWIEINKSNAEQFKEGYDFCVIHDPQPLGMIKYVDWERNGSKWIWRCHIDTSTSYQPIWDTMTPYVDEFDATIFTLPEYDRGSSVRHRLHFPPCIDPLSPKNIPLNREAAQEILSGYGVDVNRPLVTQVSRFDPWKDPLGVIAAYKRVKKDVPDLQLAMVGSMAHDDPEGWHYYEKTLQAKGDDQDIFILTNLEGVGNVEVNAFQTYSDIVLQKSIVEGFGLTVSEALWKGRPVIGGRVGGIRMQIKDGETGYLVDSIDECVERMREILTNPQKGIEMGKAGREWVRGNFLSTRNLRDYLTLFNRLRDEKV